MRHYRLVKLIASHAQTAAEDYSSQGNDRYLAGASTNIHDHVSRRFMDRKTDPDGRRHRLLDQIYFARSGMSCRILHSPLFHLGNAGRHGDDNPGSDQFAMMHSLNEMPQHRFGDLEVGDHAVFHRPYGHDISRGPSQHAFGFLAHRQHVGRAGLDGHDGRLAEHDALVSDINQRIGRAQVYSDVVGKEAL